MFFRKPHEALARAMHQPGVCGEGDRLLLHGRSDNHLGEVRWSRGARSRRDRKALLQERARLLLAHALTPARQRRALERKLVAKELLAAEELIVRIIQPALAQDFIGEIVRVLQDRQARHAPCGKRRLTRPVRINGAEALLQKIPVDRARKFHERAIPIGDLVEPCLEQIILPAVPPLPRSHRNHPPLHRHSEENHAKSARSIFARKPIHSAESRRIRCHEYAKALCLFSALRKLHGRLSIISIGQS
jgi:hypothetical protein